MMTLEELRRIAEAVGERRGWSFARVREECEIIPWDYEDVARRYLQADSHVLDIGTGGGERFLPLALYIGSGVGIDADPAMIEVARQNTPPSLKPNVTFEVMTGNALHFPDATFDVVLNRHAPVHVDEIVRVLRPGGVFLTQQVGPRNTANICALFGCGPDGKYRSDPAQSISALTESFRARGCTIIGQAEYDVRSWFKDIESLVFWLKAIPLPEDFDVEKHWPQVDRIVAEFSTPRGVESNEHRHLLVVRKP